MKRGEKHSAETRAQMSAAHKNRSPEATANILAAQRSPGARAKRSAAHKGKKASPETREKMAEAHRRQWADPVQGERLRAAAQNRVPAAKRARAPQIDNHWDDPEVRAATRATDAYKTRLAIAMRLKSKIGSDDDPGDTPPCP